MQGEFFNVLSVQDFLGMAQELPRLRNTETIPAGEALQRVLAVDITAQENLPPFNRAAMDGYAVCAADTFGCSEANPTYLEIVENLDIGVEPEQHLFPGQCTGIVTGAVLPAGADSVVMQEYAQELGVQEVEIRRPVAPGENMLKKGEDSSVGDPVLRPGLMLRPQDIALLSALGQSSVQVFTRPRIGIISTGDELVPIDAVPQPGQIRDVNTYAINSWLQSFNFPTRVWGIVPDSLSELSQALDEALQECDHVLLSGGSSVGYRDLTVQALKTVPGCRVLVHGVAISPGKPTILAQAGQQTLIGLPGQVTSVQVVLYVLILPLLQHLSGLSAPLRPGGQQSRTYAELSRNIATRQGREDYVRVRLQPREDQLPLAEPVLGKSGLLRTMLQADGILRVPAECEGLDQGTWAEVLLL